MKRFLKFAILAIGTLLVCRFIGSRVFDAASGLGYEQLKRYPVGGQDMVIAEENGGATTSYATSFHLTNHGENPSTENRVLVIPNSPNDVNINQNGQTFSVLVNGENQPFLEKKQSFDGVIFNLSFSADKSE